MRFFRDRWTIRSPIIEHCVVADTFARSFAGTVAAACWARSDQTQTSAVAPDLEVLQRIAAKRVAQVTPFAFPRQQAYSTGPLGEQSLRGCAIAAGYVDPRRGRTAEKEERTEDEKGKRRKQSIRILTKLTTESWILQSAILIKHSYSGLRLRVSIWCYVCYAQCPTKRLKKNIYIYRRRGKTWKARGSTPRNLETGRLSRRNGNSVVFRIFWSWHERYTFKV